MKQLRGVVTTKAQRDEAIKMYVEGELIKDILHYTGLSSLTLYKEINERGIPLRKPDGRGGRPHK